MRNQLTESARSLIDLSRGGSYSNVRDVIKHRLYDTRYFDSTISDHTFFQTAIGDTWRNSSQKTINETNMYDTGKLPRGQVFLAIRMGIQCIIPPALDATVSDDYIQSFIGILDSSVFEIKISGREYDYQIHGSEFLPMLKISGNTGSTSTVVTGGAVYPQSGWSSLKPTPIIIDEQVSFNVKQTLSNPDSNVDTILDTYASLLNGAYATMKVTLEGLLTRAK